MILLGACIIAAAILVPSGLWWMRSDKTLRLRHRQTVVVTLKTGEAFRGVLFDTGPDALVLRNAETLGDSRVAVDGEVLILRPDVSFIQRP